MSFVQTVFFNIFYSQWKYLRKKKSSLKLTPRVKCLWILYKVKHVI